MMICCSIGLLRADRVDEILHLQTAVECTRGSEAVVGTETKRLSYLR